jgi:predicted enzyme related to lactoylglutathione lyase
LLSSQDQQALDHTMRENHKLDYLEMTAGASSLADVKAFYARAFGWSFTDYGPAYAAFNEGLEGGFNATDDNRRKATPLPVLFSTDLEKSLAAVAQAGGTIIAPIYNFPGGRRFHFTDPAGNELAVWAE